MTPPPAARELNRHAHHSALIAAAMCVPVGHYMCAGRCLQGEAWPSRVYLSSIGPFALLLSARKVLSRSAPQAGFPASKSSGSGQGSTFMFASTLLRWLAMRSSLMRCPSDRWPTSYLCTPLSSFITHYSLEPLPRFVTTTRYDQM